MDYKIKIGQLLDETKDSHSELHEKILEYLKKLPQTPPKEEVEKIFGSFCKDIELKIVQENRKKEYEKIDSLFIEALVEELKENRSEKIVEYLLLRKDIKNKYPKLENKDV